MGNTCTNVKLNTVDELLITKDENSNKYKEFNKKGSYEEIFKLKESLFDVFKFYSIADYLQFLNTTTPDTESKNSLSCYDLIYIHRIIAILKNKFLRSPLMLDNSNSKNLTEKSESDLNQYLNRFFNTLKINKQSIDKHLDGFKIKEDLLTVMSLYPIGFLYCSDDIEKKIKVMFNLVSSIPTSGNSVNVGLSLNNNSLGLNTNLGNENKNGFNLSSAVIYRDSKELKRLLYFLLIYPTNLIFVATNDLSEEDEVISSKLSTFDLNVIYGTFQSKDAYEIIDEILNKLFADKTEIDVVAFEQKMVEHSLHWIFDPVAIRYEFEEYNKKVSS